MGTIAPVDLPLLSARAMSFVGLRNRTTERPTPLILRRAIALRLGIALDTVKNHISVILHKSGCKTFDRVCTLYGQTMRPVEQVDGQRADAV
jgi:hypothetical protein